MYFYATIITSSLPRPLEKPNYNVQFWPKPNKNELEEVEQEHAAAATNQLESRLDVLDIYLLSF